MVWGLGRADKGHVEYELSRSIKSSIRSQQRLPPRTGVSVADQTQGLNHSDTRKGKAEDVCGARHPETKREIHSSFMTFAEQAWWEWFSLHSDYSGWSQPLYKDRKRIMNSS